MKKIKWGMVGTGIIANEFAASFNTENAELVAVGSRTFEKAQDFANQYNIPQAYGSYQELYEDKDVNIVYFATPNSHHAENMLDALEAGKHVFCEKAITMNKKELDEVIKLAKEKELLVAEAMTIYHMPIYNEIKKRIDRGEFGDLKLATAYFGSLKDEDPSQRFFNPELGGGALLDIGVYALSFVQFFLNSDPVDFKTIVQMHPSGVDDKSVISYTTKSDALANVVLSFRGKLPKQGVVVCEDAHITFNDYPRADQAVITYADGRTEIVGKGEKKDAIKYEIENISKSILLNKDLTNIDNTIRVNYLMDKAAHEWGMDWIFE